MNGITDIIATVTVPKPEYEALVRDSQTLEVVARYVASEKYITQKDIRILIGMESEVEQDESV